MAAAPSGAWPQGSALLLCDYQNFIMKGVLGSAEAAAKAAKDAQPVISAAREARVPIIYVAVRFREGAPEVSDTNKMFSAYKASGGIAGLYEGTEGAAIHSDVAPEAGDVVVVKRRVGAFSTTDLAAVLSGLKVQHLVLCGYSTSGVILSTVRWAADADFVITVLSDLCGDRDEEVHKVLCEKVFPRQAAVTTSSSFLAGGQ